MSSYPAHGIYLVVAGMLLACTANEPNDSPGNAGAGSSTTGGAIAGGGGAPAGAAPPSGGMAGGGSTAISGTGGSAPGGSGGGGGTGGGAVGCESEDPSLTFEENCLVCAETDCERCLCMNCAQPLQTCAETSGCPEIAACIQASQCAGIDCYCGTFDALACAAGQSDGPCKSAILAAPGGREPSLTAPSAGPASDAAIAISACIEPGASCADSCSAPD